jgi:hypothetical protein
VHQHCRSVALHLSHLAMRHRGLGAERVAFFSRDVRLYQADNQVINQLRKISCAFLIAERDVVEWAGNIRYTSL